MILVPWYGCYLRLNACIIYCQLFWLMVITWNLLKCWFVRVSLFIKVLFNTCLKITMSSSPPPSLSVQLSLGISTISSTVSSSKTGSPVPLSWQRCLEEPHYQTISAHRGAVISSRSPKFLFFSGREEHPVWKYQTQGKKFERRFWKNAQVFFGRISAVGLMCRMPNSVSRKSSFRRKKKKNSWYASKFRHLLIAVIKYLKSGF